MKRWLIALGVFVAAAPFWVALWIALHEGQELATLEDAPKADAPAPAEAPLPAAPGGAPGVPKGGEPPSMPAPSGVLECDISVADHTAYVDSMCRLRVLLPTGVELASLRTSLPGKCSIPRLPTDVPLVVAVEAAGCLRGLCCDVRLAKQGSSAKRIVLAPAPTLRVAVTFGDSKYERKAPQGLRVELLAGEESVTEGTTDNDGEAVLVPPVFGALRARVTLENMTLVDGATVTVDPYSAEQSCKIAIPQGGVVAVQVLTEAGSPAAGTRVWLVGELSTRAPVTTDRDGVASFSAVPAGQQLTVLARGGDGSFGSVPVQTGAPLPARIPLLLGPPATLTGDVVDQGNSVIRGATVEVVVNPVAEPVVVTSDDAGLFETAPLPGGLADVVVRCDGYLEWHSPQAVEIRPGVGAKLRARMTPTPKGTVFVRVNDETGAPVEGAEVSAFPSRTWTSTDASGACKFDGLDAGSEQTFFARRRGYRSRAGALPAVRVPRDVAASVDVVLRASTAEPPEGGSVAATGVVLSPSGDPVVGARVTAGATVAFTDVAGRFRLTGLTATAAEPADLRIAPPASLLETLRVLVAPDELGLADLGNVRLRARPYALIRVPRGPSAAAFASRDRKSKTKAVPPDADAPRTFWLSSNHAQTLLGLTSGSFTPVPCVSYDGTWIHLPPADDWISDGRGEVFMGFATPRGLFTTAAAWTLAPDAAAVLAPPPPDAPARLDYPSRWKDERGRVLVRQVECATLFDPRSIHVPTGNWQPPVDPFAALAPWRSFYADANSWREFTDAVAPGRWVVGNDAEPRKVGDPPGVEWTSRQRR